MGSQILAIAEIASIPLVVSNQLPESTSTVTGFVFTAADGKTTLTEPSTIATYLSEAAADKTVASRLVGATPGERLTLQQWLFWNQARFEPAVKQLSAVTQGGSTHGPEQKTAARDLVGMVEHLEKGLRDEQWNGRDTLLDSGDNSGPSLADVAVASTLLAAWAVGFDEDTRGDFPNALKLYERVSQIEGLGELFPEESSLDNDWSDDS